MTLTPDPDTWPDVLTPELRQRLLDQKFQRAQAVIQSRSALDRRALDWKHIEHRFGATRHVHLRSQ
jgi:hypothetical protein